MLFKEESISTDSLQVLDRTYAYYALKTPERAAERVTVESSTQVGWVCSQTPIVPNFGHYTSLT